MADPHPNAASGYDWSVFATAELEALWRSHLEMADENDEDGGHVGISRHHRRQARVIGEEMNRRG